MVLNGKSSLEYPFNSGASQGPNLDATLFLLYIKDLPDDVIVILVYMLMVLLSTLI